MVMQSDYLARLNEIQNGTTTEIAMALFDCLPAVPLDAMFGTWRGSGLQTGHPLDGMLETFGWYGKRFDGLEDVHPLVFETPEGQLFNINPSKIPLGMVMRHSKLFKHPAVSKVFNTVAGLFRTTKPQARIRMTEFRGVLTATMIYDALPINDVFRRINHDTVLGVMDMRGGDKPFVFVLTQVVEVEAAMASVV